MKHIYLIGNGSRAAQYGVGTYIRQMLEFFRQTSSVRLTIVELNSEVKEVTEECDNSGKVCYLKIPAQKSEGRKGDVAHCYRNIAKRVASELFASCPFSRLAEEDRSGILFTCDYSLFGLVFHVKGKYSIVSFDYS